jgi:hypothetical protein
MKSETIRLFQTLPHPWGCFAERTAQNLVIDPAAPACRHAFRSPAFDSDPLPPIDEVAARA